MPFDRPDDWNFPLLLHVGGAMLLVGALVAVAATSLVAVRGAGAPQSPALSRLAFRTMLLAAIPSFIVMRVSAQWVASKEGLEDSDAAWIGIGYITTDAGALLLVAATVIASVAARRSARGDAGSWAGRVAPGLTVLLVVMYLVALWAMTAKPV
jgi:hypothetical protein